MSVTEDGARHITQDPAWRLLIEFAPPGEPGSEDQSAERVAEAIQELGLQPVLMERIRRAVVQAVQNAIKHGNHEQAHISVFVRVWISDPYTKDLHGSIPVAQQDRRQARHGWGFFMIERQGDPQTSGAASQRAVELYLYQERERSRNQNRRI